MLHHCRSRAFGYIRILELEGLKKRSLTAALDKIASDFKHSDGVIIDIRNDPGGDDSTAIAIINRFCDRKRVGFHRSTKIGPGEDDFTSLKTWHIEPQSNAQFTGPIVLLTCDSVFSGGEAFALAIKQLPHVTIIVIIPTAYSRISSRRNSPTAVVTVCPTRSTFQPTWCATKARGYQSTSSYSTRRPILKTVSIR